MTREGAIGNLIHAIRWNDMPKKEALDMAIQALEQEPSGDVISRQAVEDAIYDYSRSCDVNYAQIMEYIDKLPPVNPQEPKTGHWEWVQYDYNPKLGNWHCSECRCIVVECVDKEEKGGIPLYKYCPQCGAKMVEPQEGDKV